MNVTTNQINNLPPEQQAIQNKCFHPSGTFVEFPIEDVGTSIPARFEKVVRMYSDRIAVETDNECVTYEALNRSANRLANVILAERGANDSPIAVILPLGIAQTVAILGVLKAGKMFLLQDPSRADDELSHILADAQVKLILTTKRIQKDWHDVANLNVRVIDIQNATDTGNDQNPAVHLIPDSGAYIKYTSGSSARSKGVVIPHRTILHGVMSYTNSCHFCSEDRSAQIGGNTIRRLFFVHLLNGATLCPFDIGSEGIHGLASWMERHEITMCRSFPGVFRLFVNSLSGNERFPKLRMVRLSGEPMYGSDVKSFKKYFSSDCVMIHSYASSETGIISSYYLDHSTSIIGHRVPVGYPEKGKEVSIIDDAGNEIPAGQPGEIVVKSRFLSSGYWRRGNENTLNFQLSRENPQNKIYRTGDLGQLSADGCLTLLGRKDDRVKIRNFRVDISEIEGKLAEHPEIKLAVVTAKEDSPGDIRLIAYFVARSQPAPTVTALREFLGAALPLYMVPAVFVAMPEMPMTPTGKINRRGLPEPGKSRPNLATPFVQPTTDVERKLTAVWQEVLALDEVGIHDNFFELGGHSLAATRIIARTIKTFQFDLPIKALFDSPTVADMAVLISQNQSKRANQKSLAQLLRELEAMSDDEAERTAVTTPRRDSADGSQ